jgi:oxygen-independent coproporphyrinogen-3 oxidase
VLLYLHVPFCGRRCSYCDFAIAVRRATPADEYAELVMAEWTRRRFEWEPGGPLETVYFGGGTPSRLAPNAIERLLLRFRADRGLAAGAEVTLETNPEDVTPESAARWIAAGITRLSLGVQSFDPRVLGWMHRTHGPEASELAVRTLREAGFRNVSLDLIYGLPASLDRDWPADLERALALEPDHVSLYGLTIESATPLARWVERREVAPAVDHAAASEYLAAHESLVARGYRHYEVSNAGRPGFESRHNQGYWQRRPYIGLGPSAHSARENLRSWNIREWEAYRRRVATGDTATDGAESLSADQGALETLYLGLRTDQGVSASSLPGTEVDQWVAADWARRVGRQIVLTAEGWLRLDAVVSRVSCS